MRSIGGGSIWKVGGPNSLSPPSFLPLLFPFFAFPYSLQPLPFFLYPPFLRSRPLNAAIVFGEHCKLPQWGLGRSPSWQTIWCLFEPKEQLSLRQFFCGFFSKNVTFCTKKQSWYHLYSAVIYHAHRGAGSVMKLVKLTGSGLGQAWIQKARLGGRELQ